MSIDNNYYAWVVFFDLPNWPGLYTSRRYEWEIPTDDFVSGSLDSVREWIRSQARFRHVVELSSLKRYPFDEPSIQEVWM